MVDENTDLVKTTAFSVVEALACRRTFLSTDEVRSCSDYRDVNIEVNIAEVKQQLKHTEREGGQEPIGVAALNEGTSEKDASRGVS